MSATWRPPSTADRLCGHRRCTVLARLSAAAMIAGYLALALLLVLPSIATIAAALGLIGAGFSLAYWPHPHAPAGDPGIEALVNATREERFTGLGGHFDEWEREMSQR